MTIPNNRQGPLFDIHPVTGVRIEVFFADRLATFGRGGAGWFWWSRRRGFAPEGPAHGPFGTNYAAYSNALHTGEPTVSFGRRRANLKSQR
jgi:hypothetical protein